MTRVLVVSPHPDDESIGCGGTLRKHVLEGDEVRVIFLTSGEAGIPGYSAVEAAPIREAEAEKATEVLGVAEIEFWHEPDGTLRAHADLIHRLQDLLAAWSPERIYVTHQGEMYRDHQAAARLVRRAVIDSDPRPAVYEFEVWTPLTTLGAIVDISPYMDEKMDAIRCYRSQLDLVPFDEAIPALNRYRGELHSWPGGPYAEVFRLPVGGGGKLPWRF